MNIFENDPPDFGGNDYLPLLLRKADVNPLYVYPYKLGCEVGVEFPRIAS